MTLVKKISQAVHDLIRDAKEPFEPITNDDKRELYKEYRSFSGFLPYAEWLDEVNMLLLEDLVSVAAIWEIDPIRSEAMDVSYMEKLEREIISATAGVLERPAKHGQYVLSFYTQDEFNLDEQFELIKKSVHPRWTNSALAENYLASTKLMFEGMESEKGLFAETMRKNSDENIEGSTKPYRGGRRRHRMMLYRRVKLRDRRGADEVLKAEIKALQNLKGVISAAVSANASLKEINREGFYDFIGRLLNPAPSCAGGDVNRLLRENPCPLSELAPVGGDYATSMLHSRIETNSKHGVIEFDGHPARFLQIERLNNIPPAGALTAEKINHQSGEVSAVLDKLPSGAIFVQHIIFEDSDERKDELVKLEKRSRHADDEAVVTNEQAKKAIKLITLGQPLYRAEMGVYLFGSTIKELDMLTERSKVVLQSELSLKAVSPENDLFPVQSFIRNLPMVYDPFLDNRRKRGRTFRYNHLVPFMPLFGRTRGFLGRSKKVCSINWNRLGETVFFDPLDFDGNAHMTLLGPSGLGKSATLNKTIVELILFKNARIFIAEAGMSFDPLMDFLEAENFDVQRVNIGTGKNSKPVAPFGNAKKARDEYIRDYADTEDGQMAFISATATRLEQYGAFFSENVDEEYEGLSEEAILEKRKGRAEAIREKISKSFLDGQNSDGSSELDGKDFMGECVMIAKIMVTGGSEKEEERFRLQDVTFLTKAIIDAANISDAAGENIVRPTHLEQALRLQAQSYTDNLKNRERLEEMADNMSRYTSSIRGRILDKDASPFRLCDCLHVELGMAQRDGNEDLLALAYLSLMNMINDVAESKAAMNDDRPIYVITDEAHLILKDRRIAPVAVKIVRMWRKYGAWFLAATQDIAKSFIGEAAAILQICEYFIALKPPPADLEALAKLASLSEADQALVRQAKAEKYKYTEAVVINKTRQESALIRIVQPSFTLALALTDDEKKVEREALCNKYGLRTAGGTLVQMLELDRIRGLISDEQYNNKLEALCADDKYHAVVAA